MVGKPVNPKCGLLVECVGNRHDDNDESMLVLVMVVLFIMINTDHYYAHIYSF